MVIDPEEHPQIVAAERPAHDLGGLGIDGGEGAVAGRAAGDLPGGVLGQLLRRVRLRLLPRGRGGAAGEKLHPAKLFLRGADLLQGAAERLSRLLLIQSAVTLTVEPEKGHISVVRGDEPVQYGGRYAVFRCSLRHEPDSFRKIHR